MPTEFTTKALFDRVIIKPDVPEFKKIGALEVLASNAAEPDRGLIMSIGPGTADEPTQAKAGQRVIFSMGVAEKLTIECEDYLLMREEDLIAIM